MKLLVFLSSLVSLSLDLALYWMSAPLALTSHSYKSQQQTFAPRPPLKHSIVPQQKQHEQATRFLGSWFSTLAACIVLGS